MRNLEIDGNHYFTSIGAGMDERCWIMTAEVAEKIGCVAIPNISVAAREFGVETWTTRDSLFAEGRIHGQ